MVSADDLFSVHHLTGAERGGAAEAHPGGAGGCVPAEQAARCGGAGTIRDAGLTGESDFNARLLELNWLETRGTAWLILRRFGARANEATLPTKEYLFAHTSAARLSLTHSSADGYRHTGVTRTQLRPPLLRLLLLGTTPRKRHRRHRSGTTPMQISRGAETLESERDVFDPEH